MVPSGVRAAPGSTVALDLLGSDPATVVDAALIAAQRRPDITVLLVGPTDVAAAALSARGAAGRLEVVPATQPAVVAGDPARAVRASRDSTVRVAAALVRDGRADATVSTGSTGAAVAAALFTLGPLPGITRPALGIVMPAATGRVVLLDIGGAADAGADLLAQFALAGAALARLHVEVEDPRVALLGAADGAAAAASRAQAEVLLRELPLRYVGAVTADRVALGDADVVVTDGFTGRVLLGGVDGTVRMMSRALLAAFAADDDRRTAARALAPTLAAVAADLDPDHRGGAVVLGVDGVAVAGVGAASPDAIAHCVFAAADLAVAGVVPAVRDAVGHLVARRRRSAGLQDVTR